MGFGGALAVGAADACGASFDEASDFERSQAVVTPAAKMRATNSGAVRRSEMDGRDVRRREAESRGAERRGARRGNCTIETTLGTFPGATHARERTVREGAPFRFPPRSMVPPQADPRHARSRVSSVDPHEVYALGAVDASDEGTLVAGEGKIQERILA